MPRAGAAAARRHQRMEEVASVVEAEEGATGTN
jgi:hypothetical protein